MKRYVQTGGVSLDTTIQNADTLNPGTYIVELQSYFEKGDYSVLCLKHEGVTHVIKGPKAKLQPFKSYRIVVGISAGVCAVAYGSGYNLIEYPSKEPILKQPVPIADLVKVLKTRRLSLAAPEVTHISEVT